VVSCTYCIGTLNRTVYVNTVMKEETLCSTKDNNCLGGSSLNTLRNPRQPIPTIRLMNENSIAKTKVNCQLSLISIWLLNHQVNQDNINHGRYTQ